MSERRVRRRKPRLKFDKQMYKKLGILFWIVVLALFALCTRIAYLFNKSFRTTKFYKQDHSL